MFRNTERAVFSLTIEALEDRIAPAALINAGPPNLLDLLPDQALEHANGHVPDPGDHNGDRYFNPLEQSGAHSSSPKP